MVAASDQGNNRRAGFVPLGDILVAFGLEKNRSIEIGGLFDRLDSQFGPQQIEQLLVLGQGTVATARHSIQAHQLPVGFLGKRIDGEQPLGISNAESVFSSSEIDLNQRSETLKGIFSGALLVSH